MFDKYQMLEKLLRNLDKLADAQGLNKCALVMDSQSMLQALYKGLKDEDQAKAQEKQILVDQLEAYSKQANESIQNAGEYSCEIGAKATDVE